MAYFRKMFTGIVECTGEVKELFAEGENMHFTIQSDISHTLKIDQSLSHDGVCLTVVGIERNTHLVTAVKETLLLSTLGTWALGKKINLERCMRADGRFDGHIVQGHVDCMGTITNIADENGSKRIQISYPKEKGITVQKGSVTVNGVSLTVAESAVGIFSVVIIPYTWQNTNLGSINTGDFVNLEFDILGKYVVQYLANNT